MAACNECGAPLGTPHAEWCYYADPIREARGIFNGAILGILFMLVLGAGIYGFFAVGSSVEEFFLELLR